MKVVKEVWVAGRTIGVAIKLSTGDHTKKRAPKKNITSEKVIRNNNRLSARNLTMIINANFGKDDAHYTLTHAVEVTQKQAAKERTNFLRRLSARLHAGQSCRSSMFSRLWNTSRSFLSLSISA